MAVQGLKRAESAHPAHPRDLDFLNEDPPKYHWRMKIQGGMNGLYIRIAVRQLAAARGIRGFGGARSTCSILRVSSYGPLGGALALSCRAPAT
jgi:hypothetical protein